MYECIAPTIASFLRVSRKGKTWLIGLSYFVEVVSVWAFGISYIGLSLFGTVSKDS